MKEVDENHATGRLMMIQCVETHHVPVCQIRWQRKAAHAHARTHTLSPVSVPGVKHEKSGCPDQQIISANQQVCFWNLSYIFMLSPQELSPKVCISAVNGSILHALKYYNVVVALLRLYIMRGALTWGGTHSGREEVSDHFYSAFESR